MGCIPHPSVTLETMAYQADAAALAAKVTKPILFLPAGNDPDTYRLKISSFRILSFITT